MTKKLNDLFDLEDVDMPEVTIEDNYDLTGMPTEKESPKTLPQIQEALSAVDKIDAALPTIRDLESSDVEMDEIAETAKATFQDLMDLGMNVEARFAGEIFNNASRMLDTALSAKSHKINKKLKMVDLQLKKATLDLRINQSGSDDSVEGEGVVVDRNTLLAEILGKKV
jgi:hypothetical protein